MKLFTLLFIFVAFTSFSQAIPNKNLFPTAVDSVRLRIEKNRTKEMTLPNQNEVYELLGSVKLSAKENQKLLKRLSKNKSYAIGRALLNHYNLVFTFFVIDQVVLTVHISTLTKNISLYAEGKEAFQGKISKKMGNYLIKLLVKYKYYDTVEKIGDLEGVL